MPGDNFHVEVHSDGRQHFEAAVKLAWGGAPGRKATHYVSQGLEKVGMVLLSHEDMVNGVKAIPLPFPLSCTAAVEFLWSWLQTAEYSVQPDHDGDNIQGFIVTTGNEWGHVEDSFYAFIGVYPDWQMYGK